MRSRLRRSRRGVAQRCVVYRRLDRGAHDCGADHHDTIITLSLDRKRDKTRLWHSAVRTHGVRTHAQK